MLPAIDVAKNLCHMELATTALHVDTEERSLENTKGRLVGVWFGEQSFTRTEYDEQAWRQEISSENRP